MRRGLRTLCAVAILAALGLAGLAGARAQDTAGAGGSAGQFVPEIRAQLVPVRSAVLAAGMSGQIEMLEIRDGQRFDAGEALVRFNCARQRAERQVADTRRQRASKLFENRDKLNKLQGIAGIELDLAAADVAQAEAELRLQDVMVRRCGIAAPFAGVVAEVHARPHQYIAEGEPLLELIDDSTFEIEMLLPSAWLRTIETGHSFRLEVEETGRTYDADLIRISGKIDPVSQSVKAYGRIQDPSADLRAGMSGRALFPLIN